MYCTSIELISVVRCYELVLDVSSRQFECLARSHILF